MSTQGRRPGRPKALSTMQFEVLERLSDHDKRIRDVEMTQAKILGALVFIAAEIPVAIAVATLFLKQGQ